MPQVVGSDGPQLLDAGGSAPRAAPSSGLAGRHGPGPGGGRVEAVFPEGSVAAGARFSAGRKQGTVDGNCDVRDLDPEVRAALQPDWKAGERRSGPWRRGREEHQHRFRAERRDESPRRGPRVRSRSPRRSPSPPTSPQRWPRRAAADRGDSHAGSRVPSTATPSWTAPQWWNGLPLLPGQVGPSWPAAGGGALAPWPPLPAALANLATLATPAWPAAPGGGWPGTPASPLHAHATSALPGLGAPWLPPPPAHLTAGAGVPSAGRGTEATQPLAPLSSMLNDLHASLAALMRSGGAQTAGGAGSASAAVGDMMHAGPPGAKAQEGFREALPPAAAASAPARASPEEEYDPSAPSVDPLVRAA
jgi:hypothetical protein